MVDIETHHVEIDPAEDDNADVRACMAAWHDLRGNQLYPAWADFDWLVLPTSILPYMVVVDVSGDGSDFRFRYWGSAHTEVFHEDYTHKTVSQIQPPDVAQGLLGQYRRVLEVSAPCLFVFEVLGGANRDFPVRETSLRMPFAGKTETIDHIVSLSDNRRQAADFAEFFAANRRGA